MAGYRRQLGRGGLGLSAMLGHIMIKLPPDIERLLLAMAEELNDDDTVGVCLAGSYARCDATDHSDVDLLRFVHSMPKTSAEEYDLQVRDGNLISITQTTFEQKLDELLTPEDAIHAVPGLRQMCILLDKDGALAELKERAERFEWWAPLQQEADEYASYSLMGYAEEVHKVLSRLSRDDESAVQYGNLGLYMGLAKALVVQRGVLIESENTFFR